jgi:hypothetical protein
MPPSLESRVKKCFAETRLFRITDHVAADIQLALDERVLGVYFNKNFDDYSDGFVLSSRGLYLLLPGATRFIAYEDIETSDLHKNKADQGRELKYRYVELILKSGEHVKVHIYGEYENGCLDLYNLDRFLAYVYRDSKLKNTKHEQLA